MADYPAVEGLLKHQVMLTRSQPGDWVLTLWTFQDEFPVPGARLDYERGTIVEWLEDEWKPQTRNDVSVRQLKTWDFGTTPPPRYPNLTIFPYIVGSDGSGPYGPQAMAAIVALRSEPLGSPERNRLNGRIYHPAHKVENNQVVAPNRDALRDAYNNLAGRLDEDVHPDSGSWVVPSWQTAGAPRVPPLMVFVDHCIVRPQCGFQRRRMPHAPAYALGS